MIGSKFMANIVDKFRALFPLVEPLQRDYQSEFKHQEQDESLRLLQAEAAAKRRSIQRERGEQA